MHTLYFDRSAGTINGFLTLQEVRNDGTAVKVFSRLPARSGQSGFENTSWQRGKSPVPFGRWTMDTKPIPLTLEPVGTPFFPVYSNPHRKRIIRTADGLRQDIGLHYENEYPGSLGCVAVLRTPKSEMLFKYLQDLGKVGELRIPFVVL